MFDCFQNCSFAAFLGSHGLHEAKMAAYSGHRRSFILSMSGLPQHTQHYRDMHLQTRLASRDEVRT